MLKSRAFKLNAHIKCVAVVIEFCLLIFTFCLIEYLMKRASNLRGRILVDQFYYLCKGTIV